MITIILFNHSVIIIIIKIMNQQINTNQNLMSQFAKN